METLVNNPLPTTALGAALTAAIASPQKKAKSPRKSKPAAKIAAKKDGVSRKAPTGLGKPNAKKVVNPQNTLELKKSAVRAAGGKMVWGNRTWTITCGKKDFIFASRELAALTTAQLVARVSKKSATPASPAAPSPDSAPAAQV
jgi:hypothetical protein